MRAFAILLVSIFLFTSCSDDDNFCIKGSGDIVTEEISLADIHSIDLDISVDIVITESTNQKIQISGQQNIIDIIKKHSTVNQGLWRVKWDRNCVIAEDIRIFADIKSLESLRVDGSGSIKSDGVFNEVTDLDLEINGSGKIDLDLNEVDNLLTIVDGSGFINLGDGTADFLKVDINGSGDLDAFPFEATDCEVNIKGSGDVEVNVTNDLVVDIDGSGDLCYRGNPSLSFAIDGSGSVNECN